MRTLGTLGLALALLVTSCQRTPPKETPAAQAPAVEASVASAPAAAAPAVEAPVASASAAAAEAEMKAAHAAALAALPADMFVVATLRTDALWGAVGGFAGATPPGGKTLRERLGAIFESELGVDLTRSPYVSVGASFLGGAVAVLPGAGAGTPRGAQSADGATVLADEIVMLRAGELLLVGMPKAVDAARKVILEGAPSLGASPEGAVHRDLATAVGNGFLVVTASTAFFAKQTASLGGTGLTAGAFAVAEDISLRATLRGDPTTVRAIEALYRKAMDNGRAELGAIRDKLVTEGLAGKLGATTLDFWMAGIPELTWTFDDKGGTVATPALLPMLDDLFVPGILASVAVPAFIKYMRRAKSAEALMNLDHLYKATILGFIAPRADAAGRPLACRFPDSAPATPAGSPCELPDERYPGSADAWTHPTWQALAFAPTEPLHFRYEYASNGKEGAEASATVSAYADLDCDGVWSTFRRTIEVDPSSTPGACLVTGRGPLFVENELE